MPTRLPAVVGLIVSERARAVEAFFRNPKSRVTPAKAAAKAGIQNATSL
jgi:hypothetical protein